MGTDVGMGEGEAGQPEQKPAKALPDRQKPAKALPDSHNGSAPSRLLWARLLLSGRMARGVQVGQISNKAGIWLSICLPPKSSFSAASGLRRETRRIRD